MRINASSLSRRTACCGPETRTRRSGVRESGFNPEAVKAVSEYETNQTTNKIAHAKAETANKLATRLTWGLIGALGVVSLLALLPKSFGLAPFEFVESVAKFYLPIVTLALGYFFGAKAD